MSPHHFQPPPHPTSLPFPIPIFLAKEHPAAITPHSFPGTDEKAPRLQGLPLDVFTLLLNKLVKTLMMNYPELYPF
ncbi:hypothetical protein ACS0TY_024313 [Phlomoides rotata]